MRIGLQFWILLGTGDAIYSGILEMKGLRLRLVSDSLLLDIINWHKRSLPDETDMIARFRTVKCGLDDY